MPLVYDLEKWGTVNERTRPAYGCYFGVDLRRAQGYGNGFQAVCLVEDGHGRVVMPACLMITWQELE